MAVRTSILLPETAFGIDSLDGHIDGAPELMHEQTVDVTQFPIGKDAFTTDHAIVRPFKLSGRFVTSNRFTRQGRPVSSRQRMQVAWDALLYTLRNRQPVQVMTAHATYANMLFTRISREENETTGTALIVDFQMQQIQYIGIEIGDRRTQGDIDPGGDGSDAVLTRGNQSLIELGFSPGIVYPTSGTVPLVNVRYQSFSTNLGENGALFEITYHENGFFWDMVIYNVAVEALLTRPLFAGPKIDIGAGYGTLEVVSSSVETHPSAPSDDQTRPWGTDFKLRWTL